MGKKVFVDLSHPFFGDMPLWPYFSKPEIAPMHSMAKGGVLTQTIKCTMHTGTHADAPRHVMESMFDGSRALYSHELPVDAYCGDAVCLDIKRRSLEADHAQGPRRRRGARRHEALRTRRAW